MGEDKEWPVSAMTKQEREEMLSLQEQGELPDIIDRSTDLYFRFLLGTPARNTHLAGHTSRVVGARQKRVLTTLRR